MEDSIPETEPQSPREVHGAGVSRLAPPWEVFFRGEGRLVCWIEGY